MDGMDRVAKTFFLGLGGVAGLLFGSLMANGTGLLGSPLSQVLHQLTVGGLIGLFLIGVGMFLTISAIITFIKIK